MKVEQHRIRCIFAFDEHPLLHTVDIQEDLFREATRQRTSVLSHEGLRFAGETPILEHTHENKDASQKDRKDDQHDLSRLSRE
jgi:hypothetical protein